MRKKNNNNQILENEKANCKTYRAVKRLILEQNKRFIKVLGILTNDTNSDNTTNIREAEDER